MPLIGLNKQVIKFALICGSTSQIKSLINFFFRNKAEKNIDRQNNDGGGWELLAFFHLSKYDAYFLTIIIAGIDNTKRVASDFSNVGKDETPWKKRELKPN